jgi:hypothetical protein
MPEQRKITAAIMKYWGPHKDLRALGAPHQRGRDMHIRHATQTYPCISKTVHGQPGHSLLQEAMTDDEDLNCAASKRNVLNWTPLAWLNSLSHHTGFSTSVAFNKAKVMQDWTAWNCQQLGLPIPHLTPLKHDACTCGRLMITIDNLGDHLHCCSQHAGATTGAHEYILTAVQRLFTLAGYKTDRKHVPHSRGLRKADLVVKDFGLAGVRDLIIDVSLCHEFHGACAANHELNGDASHAGANGALDAAVKRKLDSYHRDYNERNFFFLPAIMSTAGRISGDFLRLLYILSDRQAHTYFTRMVLLDHSPEAFKQRRGSYFYYNRAAIGLACAQATAMRIDIAPHKRPLKKLPHHDPNPHLFHIPSHARIHH